MMPDFDSLPASPELDWLVLHHALDWKLGYPALGQAAYLSHEQAGEDALWPVSTDWAAAERVVAVLEERGIAVHVEPGFHATVSGPQGRVTADGETAALAVARAVIKAVGALLIVKR